MAITTMTDQTQTNIQPGNVPQGLDPTAFYLSKSIGSAERDPSQPDMYSQRGKSGEYGAFQFLPATWNAWSQKYLGQSVPLEQSTPDQQNQVAYSRVKDLLDQGKTQSEIASMWNSGDPGAKSGTFTVGSRAGNPSVSTNGLGVDYDVPGYVNKVQKYYNQYASGLQQPITPKEPDVQSTEEQKPSFLQEEGSNLNTAWQEASHKQDLASPLIGAGALANAAINIPVKHAIRLVNSILTKIPAVAGLEGDFKNGISKILQTPVGQAMVGAATKFQKDNPRLSGAIGGVTDMVQAGITLSAITQAGGAIKNAVGTGLKAHAEEGIANTLMTNGYSESQASEIANTLVQHGANPIEGMVGNTLNTRIATNVLNHALADATSATAKTEIESALAALTEINGQTITKGFLGSALSTAGHLLKIGAKNAARFGLPLLGAEEGVRRGLFNIGASSPK